MSDESISIPNGTSLAWKSHPEIAWTAESRAHVDPLGDLVHYAITVDQEGLFVVCVAYGTWVDDPVPPRLTTLSGAKAWCESVECGSLKLS